jgi:hypothetical protein
LEGWFTSRITALATPAESLSAAASRVFQAWLVIARLPEGGQGEWVVDGK